MTSLVRSIGDVPRRLVNPFDGTGGAPKPLTPAQVAASNDAPLKQAVANGERVMGFLKDRFGRDGLDGRGRALDLVVHAVDPIYGGRMNNAYWDDMAGKMFVGDGDGTTFTHFGAAADIIAHEAGHAVLDSEVRLGFEGQEGALHESFGDVLGVLVDPDDWQVGEDAFTPGTPGDALRDLSKPQRYEHMDDVIDPTTPTHLLADIPNLAAYRAAEKIGRAEMGRVWYDAFTQRLKDHGRFSDAAGATIASAKALYGATSSQAAAVADAWTSVGVLAPTS